MVRKVFCSLGCTRCQVTPVSGRNVAILADCTNGRAYATMLHPSLCSHYPAESHGRRMRFGVQDAFFYSLVYDNQQKSLIADHGEIRVGLRYQVEIIPDKLESRMS